MRRFILVLAAGWTALFALAAPARAEWRRAAIIISSEDQAEATETARRIGRAAPRVEQMAVFGPAPAPLAMLRGRHRLRLLVHAAGRCRCRTSSGNGSAP